jgi:hypothetical protein
VSAELASYGGGLSAGQGAYGFEPPLSPATAGPNQNSIVTNTHGYLGLVPGPAEQPQTAAAGFAPVAEPAPAADPAAATTAALESLLLRFGLVSSDQLGEALREQAETGRPVGAIVVERGWVSAADIERLTGNQVAAAPAPAPAPAPDPAPAVEAPAPFPPVLELEDPPAPVFRVVEPEPAPAPEPFLAVGPVEPDPEPAPALPPVTPIVPFHGTFTPMDEPEDPVAVALPGPPAIPAPVIPLEPPVAPAPEPVQPFQPPVEPEPVAEAVPFVSEPVPTPPAVPLPAPVAPAPQPAPAATAPDQPSVKHLVIARLTTGERVEVNSYADRNAARAEAKALMAYLREGHKDWPFVNGRFIRPESIVSIDLETVLLT